MHPTGRRPRGNNRQTHFHRVFAHHKGKRIVLVINEIDLLKPFPTAQVELYDALQSMRVLQLLL
jgi:hypothetical protein